ncbi:MULTISPECIES: glucosyl-3-phosphoglycerate synthase [Actinomadura]|uniref:Glucosyl-3-phosphoglycerate synthase n=1 Tax=Actinomadura madurae TaxID=1993 RepID=A0A1I5HE28_9ACTN|nr:glucosyl-3-phosphoglycerate synthase [Actinomadura madurae]URM93019.1 glucosyl-3-phosphoglycerate synthase [Actinomadura madurae]URN03746.1 glucosyl-3-phosphoglycerate synthase [Actinomadura madurae]SFO46513.1 glucosyl-3-phosphoglycerate synthase [Actinomadura madurae]SPT57701.1 putative glucosyl-3-phosphoglycerate synthase [Actinomadura madurae]
MLPEVASWLDRRTSTAEDWPPRLLLAAKGDTRISVVLPARDEEATVGAIVAAVRTDLVERIPLVDEIVVVDSRSRDRTAAVAAAAGAGVVAQDAVLPEQGRMSGKGEALWKSLAATSGDLIVFVDADLREFASSYITGLLGPLLTDPSVGYVKGCYDRPLVEGGRRVEGGGGRVTELVARPLINLHWPLLAGVMQPLGGEYAGRRALLERMPFVTGYGVELGLLLDIYQDSGLDAIAQVDLGRRVHAHQSTEALGAMSGQIMLTAWSRLERHGRMLPLEAPSTALTRFHRAADGHDARTTDVAVGERPPMIEVPAYAAARSFSPGRR